MKNHKQPLADFYLKLLAIPDKQLLADFYLELLAIPATDIFRLTHQSLYAEVRTVLAIELDSDAETVQTLFERMVREDAKF